MSRKKSSPSESKTPIEATAGSDAPNAEVGVSSSPEVADGGGQVGTRIEGLAPLARLFGADPNTIRKWLDRGLPFVQQASGRGVPWVFDGTDVHKWIVQHEVKKALENAAMPEGGEEDEVLKEWEKRKLIASTERVEHALATDRMIYIRMDDAVAERERADANVRGAANEVPGRYATLVAAEADPVVCMRILREAMDELLAGLVLVNEDIPDEFKDSPEDPEEEATDGA